MRQPGAHFTKVRTLLAKKDYVAAGKQLELIETQQLNDLVNDRQSDYHNEKLRSQRTELELSLARETQSLLTAEAAAQKAQASELRTRIETSRERRNMQLGIAATFALSAFGLVFLNARRKFQQQLQEELSKKNKSLSVAFEEKSTELVQKVREQATLEQALAERNHMETIGQIAGHVAHDFNNTLQVVAGANSLLEPLAATESQKRVLSASNRSIHTGSATVKQLLAYSRNQPLESTVFRINHYLSNNAALFRSAIGDVNSLVIENLAGDARLNLDNGQLTSSLINLMRNAADAMTTPGETVLRAELASHPIPDSSPPQVLAQMQFQVIDRGEGMTAEVADRALEPYYSTKAAELGTGLGLSSVYGFATQSGGSIAIESQIGNGTTVTLCFPKYEGPVRPENSAAKVESMLNKAKVLLVEDNSLIAETLDAMLNQEGAETARVDTADAAQEKFAGGSEFDLILSYVNLRGAMNGFDFARWVESEHPDSQIGIMSGYGPAMEQNFEIPILAKPFTRQQLLAYLSERGFVGARLS